MFSRHWCKCMHTKALVPETSFRALEEAKELQRPMSFTLQLDWHTQCTSKSHSCRKENHKLDLSWEKSQQWHKLCSNFSSPQFFTFVLHISKSYFSKDVLGDKVTSPVNLLSCERATPEQCNFPLGCEACPPYYAIDFHNNITSSPGSLRGVVLSPTLCGFSHGC